MGWTFRSKHPTASPRRVDRVVTLAALHTPPVGWTETRTKGGRTVVAYNQWRARARVTLPGTNMEVENGPLEDNFPLLLC